jgi:hypothetical protein
MTDTNIYNDDNEKSRNRKTAEEVEKLNQHSEDGDGKGGEEGQSPKIQTKKVTKMDGVQTEEGDDPTRFGDWTKNGRAIDF